MLNLSWDPASMIAGPVKAIGAMGEGGGGGVGSFLQKLVGDDRFWQYIFATGQDMLQNTPGKNIGEAYTQNLKASNVKGVLEQILKGGGTIDSKDGNLTLKMPNPMAQPGGVTGSTEATQTGTAVPASGGTAPTGTMNTAPYRDLFQQIYNRLNPL